MRDADKTIETVLRGLAQAEAGPDFEARLERRVRNAMRAATPASAGIAAATGLRGSVPRLGRSWHAATACLFAAALITALAVHWQHRRVTLPPASAPDIAAGEPAAKQSPRTQASEIVRQPEPVRQVGRPVRSRRVPAQGENAIAESFPAPPLPLTEQEQLLLKVAHHPAPEDVAMLDRARQAHEEIAETTAFLDFFGRPAPAPEALQQTKKGDKQ